ncbi:GatB/YqeY domain-containing protein [Alloprevotella sp. OH1205_COT-284]|uniref:GatB/YqeY domain-containing protein n=1 Tax=Alloprevotella sp. OH1205_COT-284 TaxID=2491043 RepID=UPI000F5FFF7F|nr:GatB/YqeY domain-containing protein [Alloprevotella sp. OH1205_COT-284]RRD77752.1 GatB/YqeY domain-containing protein [Alloprevotella sp. OH1205_COT-284]
MLFEQISADIMAAMKAKDKVRTQALRNIKKCFIEAKTAPGNNGELTDEAALKILAKLAKQGRDTAQLYTEQNRPDLAEAELAEVAVIDTYLPRPLSDEELTTALRAIIEELGVSSVKEMGKVMGVATQRLSGQADGRAISTKVKELLN